METLKLLGIVIPVEHKVSLHLYPATITRGPQPFSFSGTLENSKVEVSIAMPAYDPASLGWLHYAAMEYVSAPVNLLAFSQGIGLQVRFEAFEMGAEQGALSFPNFDLVRHLGGADVIGDWEKWFEVASQDRALMFALKDLIAALFDQTVVGVNCGRAIETLRNGISATNDRSKDWAAFRSALRVGETYVSSITDHSIPGRHGDWSGGWSRNSDTLHRSWEIAARYLHLRRLGGSLPASEFPVLAG